MRFRKMVLLAAVAVLAGSAHAQYVEAEPNDTKAQALANGPLLLSAGSTITGSTSGISTSGGGGPTSADTFLVRVQPLPPGIYKHRLAVIPSSAAFTVRILGTSAINPAVETVLQTSLATGRFAQWYGFGRSERLYVRITGGNLTSAYTLGFQTTPIAATVIPTTFVPGQIENLSTSSIDTEVHVFDAALQEIRDYQNDDPVGSTSLLHRLMRPYANGTYYIAVARFDMASTYPTASSVPNAPGHYYPGSLGGERLLSPNVFDFPDVICAGNATISATSVSFQLTDATGIPVAVPASIVAHEIAWLRMDVGPACVPPAITSSPASLEVCYGNSATFSASATGTAPLSYQWTWNSSPIPGGNAPTLTIPVVDFSFAGVYVCVVSNACGSASTAPASLLVHPAGPEITDHPDPLTLCVGETASFSVSAIGHMNGALEYQWMKDGAPILDATASTLSFPVSGLADGGNYLCRVTEIGCGTTDSSAALLEVKNAAPVIQLVGDAEITLECGHYVWNDPGATVSDDCDTALAVVTSGDTVDPHGLGHYVIRYDAVDSLGNPAAQVERHVFVMDSVAPTLQASVATPILWSPQHEMVNVGLQVLTFDECSPVETAASVTVEVYCDEIELPDTGDGTGRHSPDSKDAAPGTLRLRSERRGAGDGRIYVMVVRTQDASGNVAFAFPTVVCPSSQNQTALNTAQAAASSISAQLVAIAGTTEHVEDIESALSSAGFVPFGTGPISGPNQ